MQRSLLANRLQNSCAFVGLNFLVSVVMNDESRNVLDDASDGHDISFTIFKYDLNLRRRHMQVPEPFAMKFDKARNCFKDIFIRHRQIIHKVDEDVIAIGITVSGAGDLKHIENRGEKSVSL